MEILILSIIIVVAVALLLTQRIRFELTSLMIVVALPATGILTPAEALSGLANEATVTVAAMFMLSAGLVRTGALDIIVRLFRESAITSTRFLILVIGIFTAVLSAFMTNTAVVIIMIPVVLRLCQRNNLVPSKVMIPLSYFAILGGTCTLVGTSTNILVDGMYRQAGGEGFSMFEFTPIGICYLLLGGTFLFLFADRILPARKVLSTVLERQHRSNFVTEVVIGRDNPAVGKTIGELLTGFEDVTVLELVRNEEVFLRPGLDATVRIDDMLLIEGSPQTIHRLLEKRGFDLASAIADDRRVKINRIDLLVVEAVVTPNSPFFNQRLRDIGLNRLFGIKVLAIQRMGRHLQVRLRETKLQVGDVLLVQGELSALGELEHTGSVLLIEGVENTLPFSRKAPLAVAIVVTVVVLAGFAGLPLSMLALGGSAAMMLFRCLRIREGLQALESSVLLLLAAAIPLGLAMEKTGMAHAIASNVLSIAQNGGATMIVSSVFLVTSILTAFLTNVATAALLAPIVLTLAGDAGIDPKPLVVAVTFGASASFFTPIGYQTNLLVMGPGGYRFRDYLVIGFLMNFIMWVAATILIPIFWPLT